MSERATKIKREDINKSLRVAVKEAIRVNHALKIPYKKVTEDKVVLVMPDGEEREIRIAAFGTVPVKKKHYTLSKQ